MCFAAGVLITASFLHIIPKSFGMSPRAPVWLLVGFLAMHVFNRFVPAFVCQKDAEKQELTLLDHELTQDDGEVTPSQKIKRRVIADRYADRIEGMYRA